MDYMDLGAISSRFCRNRLLLLFVAFCVLMLISLNSYNYLGLGVMPGSF